MPEHCAIHGDHLVTTKKCVLAGLLIAVVVPAAALALFKPSRVAIPQLVEGVHCYDGGVCTDDPQRVPEARALYSAAFTQISDQLGPFRSHPRAIFCSAAPCLKGFGLGNKAAYSVGNFGIVIAPRAWQRFFVAHELIHCRQAEEIGTLRAYRKPRWLIEGMAYSLSDDPRRPLAQPFEAWRAQFESWNSPVRGDHLWQDARNTN